MTAFSGLLDLTTGKFIYVNAGHNPPLIRRHGNNFEELQIELNFVLGGVKELALDFANMEYISSAGLRVLLAMEKSMRRQGGKMKLQHGARAKIFMLNATALLTKF